MAEPQQAYLSLIDEIRSAVEAEAGPRSLLDRAAGLLAGRVGCRVREAYTYLLRLAAEQGREPAPLAAEVIAVLEAGVGTGDDRRLRSVVDEALRTRRRTPPAFRSADGAPADDGAAGRARLGRDAPGRLR